MTPAPLFPDTKAPLSQDAALRYAEREGAISSWCKSPRPRRERLAGRLNETIEMTARTRETEGGAESVPASRR